MSNLKNIMQKIPTAGIEPTPFLSAAWYHNHYTTGDLLIQLHIFWEQILQHKSRSCIYIYLRIIDLDKNEISCDKATRIVPFFTCTAVDVAFMPPVKRLLPPVKCSPSFANESFANRGHLPAVICPPWHLPTNDICQPRHLPTSDISQPSQLPTCDNCQLRHLPPC